MKVLVTGGQGYLGSHLVERLLLQGHHVHCFSRRPEGLLPSSISHHSRFQGFCGNMGDATALDQALTGCDLCVHLAWSSLPQTSNRDPRGDLSVNLLGTVELLEACGRAGVGRFVFVSSGGTVYGVPQRVPIDEEHPTDPICAYGITKLAAEKYVSLYSKQLDFRAVTLRVANPYGGRQRLDAPQGAVAVFLGRALRREPIEIWGDGSVVRDYVDLDDVMEAFHQAIVLTKHLPIGDHRIFNIGSGEGLSLNGLLALLDDSLGFCSERCYLPARRSDVPVSVLAIERAQHDLNWRPARFVQQGVRAYYERFRFSG